MVKKGKTGTEPAPETSKPPVLDLSTASAVVFIGGFNPTQEDLEEYGLKHLVRALKEAGEDVGYLEELLDEDSTRKGPTKRRASARTPSRRPPSNLGSQGSSPAPGQPTRQARPSRPRLSAMGGGSR